MTATGLRFGHVGLNVTELDRSAAFYRAVLGLQEVGGARDADRQYVFLAGHGEVLLTLWQQSVRPFAVDGAGLHHLAFHVPTEDAVREIAGRARDCGAPVRYGGVVRHRESGTSGGVFFEDPDGIRVEVYTDEIGPEVRAPHGESPTCGFF